MAMKQSRRRFDKSEYLERQRKTRVAMESEGVDLLIVYDPANMCWLTGYDGWSFYVHQCVIIGTDGLLFWYGRGIDAKGAELTKAQIDGGADVVYQAAGGTGIGVLQAASDAGIYGIGVDTNQNWMHPGSMLTSMLKRLDLTIFEQAEKTAAGTFEPGINILGLAQGMVGYAIEDGQVTADMQSAADAAAADIVSGAITVADWSQE